MRKMRSTWQRFAARTYCSIVLVAFLSSSPPMMLAESPVHLDRKGEKWAKDTLHRMSMEEKIGQMIMPWARIEFMNVKSPQYLLLRDEMRKFHVGGFGVTVFTDGPSLLKSEPFEAAALTNGLQADSRYPLLFAADFERGLSMRLNGSTAFPAAMAFGAAGEKEFARKFGTITAREARAIGVQWNWFPVADVNSNPANPIINTRSFGEDPALVSDMVSEYIAGARSEGMLTTVKHFPGHGDTDTDSHLALARSNASRKRLDDLELIPFRAAIAAQVDAVMVAHITVPSIEPDPDRPASISYKVITQMLKGDLGFNGLVVTDALDMAALTRVFPGTPAEVSAASAVEAIRAGNDMVIIPADLEGAYNGLLNAVKVGALTPQRIDESVLKILRMKASVGLYRNRFVDMTAISTEVGRPEDEQTAQALADKAVTLVADSGNLLPIRLMQQSPAATHGVVAVIFTDDARLTDGGRAFAKLLRQRIPDANIVYADGANLSVVAPVLLKAVQQASTVIAVAESFPSARRTTPGHTSGSAGLDGSSAELLTSIVNSAGSKTIVAAFGSPYIGAMITGDQGSRIGAYLCTFSNTPDSAASLVRAIFGEIPIHGRLPVTIPGIGKRGAGLDRAASVAATNEVKRIQ